MQLKLDKILLWKANKPSTNEAWAEDVKKESLHFKHNYQLEEMEGSHENKIPQVVNDLDKFERWPDAVRYELDQQFSEMFRDVAISNVNGGQPIWPGPIPILRDGVAYEGDGETLLRDENGELVQPRSATEEEIQANWPDNVEGKTIQQWIDEEFQSQFTYYKWKKAKLDQSVDRIKKERELRTSGFLTVIKKKKDDKRFKPETVEFDDVVKVGSKLRAPIGTTYYIDADNGNAGNNGLGTGTAYVDFDNFTEVARSAGDVAICRNGMNNNYDNGSDLAFTSSGTIVSPITIEADYANAFSDDVDLSGTATATLTFGSKTVTFSADISGVLAAGDVIYAAGDAAKEFSYEVASVVTTTVTLYLPYKGGQAGSGKTMTNIQSPPRWNTTGGNFQWSFDLDDYWKIQGIHIRGTDTSGQVEIDDGGGFIFLDVIFEGDGSGAEGLQWGGITGKVILRKIRSFNNDVFIGATNAAGAVGLDVAVYDSLIDGNSISTSQGFDMDASSYFISETEVKNHTNADIWIDFGDPTDTYMVKGRNVLLSSATQIGNFVAEETGFINIFLEDFDGTVGDNRQFNGEFSPSEDNPFLQSETVKVRGGGSNKSIEITPSASLSTNWEMSKIKIFEIPFYATTDSKTYTVYFASDDNTDWDADPSATELWIELEAWGHASNNFRKITKSSGSVDFSTDTDFDQSLTVTVAPAQAGVAYLRCYYTKTKEATNANIFYCDPIPVVT